MFKKVIALVFIFASISSAQPALVEPTEGLVHGEESSIERT